jgi:phosphoribosylformylglycinamidine cyclo-ligase
MSKYKEAGVDVAKTDNLVKEISGLVDNIGGFGGLFDLGDSYLVGATDGVGTKILLAQEYDMLDGIGIDCVAMCVNDIICTGARPLFFLDYFASSNVDEKQYLTIIDSIKRGCDEAGIPLIGGETAELPSLLPDKHFDIAGFCVGIVKKKDLIDGSKIKKGDVVLAFPSNGFHSNGYSLVRKIFNKDKHEKYIDKILKPTEIYVKEIINLIDSGVNIKGIAHITGGGLSNLNRILPEGLSVNWKGEINKPFILDMFQKDGNISDEEMARVFNGGIGMCLVVEPKEVNKVFSGKIARPLIAVGNIV